MIHPLRRLSSRIRRRIAAWHLARFGKLHGAYTLVNEVELALSTAAGQGNSTAVILDVGANCGEYAAELAARASASTMVHCFEASLDHQASLQALERRFPGQVQTHPLALSSTSTTRILYKDRAGSSLASLYKRDLASHGLSLSESEPVTTTTLDSWLDTAGLGEVAFLKIDVEGHELDVLRGAEQALSQGRIQAIQFEFGGCNLDSRTYLRDFHDLLVRHHGYSLFRLAPGKRLVDLNRYHERHECFSWQNLVAFGSASLIPETYRIVIE